ncbi:CAP domain-containing protein [Thamnidium elegans]|nr:CAP domain-containing protein [Thamnidium elegans]
MIQALNSHNSYRARHHVGGVNWSQDLANHAIGLSQTCVFGHMSGTGQNIAMGHSSMEVAIDAWYNEVSNYDYNTGSSSNGGEILHFTQVVWKDTTEIGCGATYCDNHQATLYVCNYRTPGNYPNQFAANVNRP